MAATGDVVAKEQADRVAQRSGKTRTMRNEWDGHVFYESSFNPDTGTLIRATQEASYTRWFKDWYGGDYQKIAAQKGLWEKKHGLFGNYYWSRKFAYSPVPETIDVAITSWCNHSCTYCYTGADTNGIHAPVSLVEKLITGLDQPPYQMAFGGGSPTQHPEFIRILERTRELGVVPNYTTEGLNLTDSILDASNELCGGVALTFHSFRGIDTFKTRYARLISRYHKQLNIHLIADKDVAKNIDALINAKLGRLNLVLLAYYTDVGRSTNQGLMPKPVYMQEFPDAIKRAMDAGHSIAFSEGLIPYFLSRPEIGVDTRLASSAEGHFNCYVDVRGQMSMSSFFPPADEDSYYDRETETRKPKPTVYDGAAQALWLALQGRSPASYTNCTGCANQLRCVVPDAHHYFICRYAEHNEPESKQRYKGSRQRFYDDYGVF